MVNAKIEKIKIEEIPKYPWVGIHKTTKDKYVIVFFTKARTGMCLVDTYYSIESGNNRVGEVLVEDWIEGEFKPVTVTLSSL